MICFIVILLPIRLAAKKGRKSCGLQAREPVARRLDGTAHQQGWLTTKGFISPAIKFEFLGARKSQLLRPPVNLWVRCYYSTDVPQPIQDHWFHQRKTAT